MRIFLKIFVIIILLGCQEKPLYNINIKQGNLKVYIPKTLQKKKEKCNDKFLLNVPSEGTLVKVFNRKKREKLYVLNSIGVMVEYNTEVYIKKDTVLVLQKTINYNQPLEFSNTKIINKEIKYLGYYKSSILFAFKNGEEIKDISELKKYETDLEYLLKIIRYHDLDSK